MTCEFSIRFSSVLNKAIVRTSLDFQGLRSVNPAEADAIYDDFVLSEDNRAAAYDQIAYSAAVVGSRLAPYILREESSAERIEYHIETEKLRMSDRMRICRYLENYFVGSLLEWWYAGRNEMLRSRNAELAEEALSGIKGQVASSQCERRLRFF